MPVSESDPTLPQESVGRLIRPPRTAWLARCWRPTGFCILLVLLIGYAYGPSLRHPPRCDQWAMFIETRQDASFAELVQRLSSYPRTRFVWPGDTQLYRPVFFLALATEQYFFGRHFSYYQAVGILYHAAACLLLLRILVQLAGFVESTPATKAAVFVPYAITLFFALNYAVVEQVIWFHVNGYILWVIFTLAAVSLLLEAERGGRRASWFLGGAWTFVLLGAFTYELGQFVAVLAGLFVAAVRYRRDRTWRRALPAGLAFFAVVFLYQGANLADRAVHHGQFTDDVRMHHILHRVFRFSTIANLARYWTFAFVQPFVPLRCEAPPSQSHRLILREQVWNGEVHLHFWVGVGIVCFILWAAAVVLGLRRTLASRRSFVLAVAGLAFGVMLAHTALIVLGRMNLRTYPQFLGENSYYPYISLLFVLLGSGVLISGWCGPHSVRWGRITGALPAVFSAALAILALHDGLLVRRVMEKTAANTAPFRTWHHQLDRFVRQHLSEPDFSFVVDPLPCGSAPFTVHGLPTYYVLYARNLQNENPKYVVTFRDSQLEAVSSAEWRCANPDVDSGPSPDLLTSRYGHNIFRVGDEVYAVPATHSLRFLTRRHRLGFEPAVVDSSLEAVLQRLKP